MGFFASKPTTRRLLPGFGLTLGYCVVYLSLIVLIPLGGLALRAADLGWFGFWDVVTAPRVQSAFAVSFGASFAAAAINSVFGFILAWSLTRYAVPGRRIIDAMIDLPFALPTAVAGIALTALFAPNGWLGAPLQSLGVSVAFSPVGIVVALLFEGLPFVVRTLEPVLQDLSPDEEEAATCLGADRRQVFMRITLPTILPALLTGFALAFARGLGEYGSVIFIAGNMPGLSEIAPLLIVIKLEQFDYAGAAALATAMLGVSFALLFFINLLQSWLRARHG